MEKINLNEDWRVVYACKSAKITEIPEAAENMRLPCDILPKLARDYDVPFGFENSYYPTVISFFYKLLPAIKKARRVFLELDGLLGIADIYIDGAFVACRTNRTCTLLDITEFYKTNALLTIKLVTHPDTGKYVGNGIAGGVMLLTLHDSIAVAPYGVHAVTKAVGEKAQLGIFSELINESDAAAEANLCIEIFNEKGKRITKKIRRVKIPAKGRKTFETQFLLSRPVLWSSEHPYLYACAASLTDGTDVPKKGTERIPFGLALHEVTDKGYRLNGKAFKIKGVVMAHDNGMLGAVSDAAAEYRKLSAIKETGYNAVRYSGKPTETVLNILDRLGLLCAVDIFETLHAGKSSGDGHGYFSGAWEDITEASVKALRNHPCVALYAIAAATEESYDRLGGHAFLKRIVKLVKFFDPVKPLTAAAAELIPTRSELERSDIKLPKNVEEPYETLSVSASRAKDLFGKLTDGYFTPVDVIGYAHQYKRFSVRPESGQRVLGLADEGKNASAVFFEADRYPHILGAFLEYGADFLGGGTTEEKAPTAHRPIYNTGGDVDSTFRRKVASYHKECLLGRQGVCAIAVQDPDSSEKEAFMEAVPLWNWPRHIGKPIKVVVYTSGDIVSLYLDGKPVGRKFAGKINNYTAVFKTDFYPGKLEAVAFLRGVEHARCVLESVSHPKAVTAECVQKEIQIGECVYVDIAVTDADGKVVPFATRDVAIEVSECGEPIALGNADPFDGGSSSRLGCSVFNGRAVAVVRGKAEGRLTVKITSEGLTGCKVGVRVAAALTK